MKFFSQKRSWAELFLPLLILAGTAYIVYAAHNAVLPLLLSAAFSYILNPVIAYFENKGIRRIWVVSGLYLTVGAVIAIIVFKAFSMMGQEITQFQSQLPTHAGRINSILEKTQNEVHVKWPMMEGSYLKMQDNLKQKLFGLAQEIPVFMIKALPVLTLLVLVPFLSFFFLWQGPAFLDAFMDLLPSRYVEMTQHILCEVDESLGNYLRGITIEAFILFMLALIGLLAMNIEYAMAIAIIVGISSLVPYIGPIIGGFLAAVAAFFQFYDYWPVLKVIFLFVSLRFIDDWFLQPAILKKAVEVHPVIIVFAMMAGAEMFGILGLIFAMPATCIIKVFLQIVIELHRTEFGWKPSAEPTRISIPYT